MGNIKLPNGEIKQDQRTNGARIRLDIGDWLKIVSMIAIIILGIGKMQWTISQHSLTLCAYEEDIKENRSTSRDNRKDIESMKASIDRIDKNVMEILKRR